MATNIIKIIDSQDKVVSQTQVTSGKSITVSAKEGQSYEFVSGATKRAPDEIKTTREGNNLKVEIKDGEEVSTTIIEDYYTNGEGDLVGLAEDGHYYSFVPQEMGADYMATDLADGVSSFQALGSEGDSMSPWWLGLPLLALGAAGGGGGSGQAAVLDTTPPDAPNVTMVTDDYDSVSAATGLFWGADMDTGSWSIDNLGNVTVNGNVNLTSDGKIITNDNTPTLSGTGEAGTIVRVYDGDIDPTDPTVNLVGETTVQPDGTWILTTSELQPYSSIDNTPDVSPLQNSEHTLNVTLTDVAGNVSDPTPINMIVDTFMTYYADHFTYTNLDDGNARTNRNADIVAGDDNFYFTGSFTLSDNYVAEPGTNQLENIPYQEGNEVYVELSLLNDAGTVIAIYQIGGPDGPTTTVDSTGKWSITVDPTQTYYNKTTGMMETLPDGNYLNRILVLETSGDYIVLNSDTLSAFGSFGIDTTAPDASQIVNTTSLDHTITINVVDSTPLYLFKGDETDGMQRDSDYLTGSGVNELTIYRDGTQVGTTYIGENTAINTTHWQDDTTLANGVYMYQVKTKDVAGNESELSDKAWVVFDNDASHDLTNADVAGKDFNEMELVGNNNSEVFTLDNVGFVSIDAGEGLDTFTLLDNSGALNITQLDGFEVFNIGNNTFNIGAETITSDYDSREFILVKGDGGMVNLDDTSWSQTQDDLSYNGGVYDVYTNSNGGDSLYVQVDVGVNLA
jgi:hypothetical protein